MITKPTTTADALTAQAKVELARTAATRLWDTFHATPTDRAALRRAAAAEAIQERLEAKVRDYGRALGWFVVD
jgi:hypothetical protein